jgi:hypothetical protein
VSNLLQIAVVSYLGWRLILRPDIYPCSVPKHLKVKHFFALAIVAFLCLDMCVLLLRLVINFGSLDRVYSESLTYFNPPLIIMIDFIGSAVGAACLILCYAAAMRSRRAILALTILIPILAIYYAFSEFKALYEKGYSVLTIGVLVSIVIGVPTALILGFYLKRKNVTCLTTDESGEDCNPHQ